MAETPWAVAVERAGPAQEWMVRVLAPEALTRLEAMRLEAALGAASWDARTRNANEKAPGSCANSTEGNESQPATSKSQEELSACQL